MVARRAVGVEGTWVDRRAIAPSTATGGDGIGGVVAVSAFGGHCCSHTAVVQVVRVTDAVAAAAAAAVAEAAAAAVAAVAAAVAAAAVEGIMIINIAAAVAAAIAIFVVVFAVFQLFVFFVFVFHVSDRTQADDIVIPVDVAPIVVTVAVGRRVYRRGSH